MSIFHLHSIVLADHRDFVRSLFTVADDCTRDLVKSQIQAPEKLKRRYEQRTERHFPVNLAK